MLTIDKCEIGGWDAAVRGMRNPYASWKQSDSDTDIYSEAYSGIGEKDYTLMALLSRRGTDHRKFLRSIVVWVDIIAPLYWWKEFDTYKVGTVSNSTSTMHNIHSKPFTLEDFSCEHLDILHLPLFEKYVRVLEDNRLEYLNSTGIQRKMAWWQIIQMLPSSYNQKRTITFNYEVLANMYGSRRNHKLDEWHEFCEWVESLPYSGLITTILR